MLMNSRPSASPASKSGTMLGWSSTAARRDSCSKRARKPWLSASSEPMRASVAMLTRPPSLRALGLARRARDACEVAVPGLDRDRLAALEVPNAHCPALHRGQRPIATILGQPDGPANGRRAVLAVGAEL